ncbi:hypothetical protein [Mycolicibacterium phlei]|uniref:hypothetical protein n=1 Tax=Mycolicibacterium phlei TaxID=1771 RepID=UPI0037C79853
MHATIRPYVTTGVALVGAGVIAVSTVAPPVLDTRLAAPPTIGAAAQLTSATNPLDAFAALFERSLENGGGLIEQFLDSPAPVLGQVVTNQLANLEYLGSTVGGFVESLPTTLKELQLAGELFADALANGNFAAAGAILNQTVSGLVTALTGVIIGPPLAIAANTVQNIANVVAVLPSALFGVLGGALAPVQSLTNAVFDIVGTIVDAAGNGDFLGAVGALVSAPIVVVDAVLNGYGPGGSPGVGLLTPEVGTIGSILNVRNVIADALHPISPGPGLEEKTADEPPEKNPEKNFAASSFGDDGEPAFQNYSDGSNDGNDGDDDKQENTGDGAGLGDDGTGDDGTTANGGTKLTNGNKFTPGQVGAVKTKAGNGAVVTESEEGPTEPSEPSEPSEPPEPSEPTGGGDENGEGSTE